MSFPKENTFIDYLAHSETTTIINKGLETPFTFKNLYDAPKEHTYHGHGKAFVDFNKELNKEGKKITFLRFLIFFWVENFGANMSTTGAYIIDFSLPLVLERFLAWIASSHEGIGGGVWFFLILVLFSVMRMFCAFGMNYYRLILSVCCKNSLEVKFGKYFYVVFWTFI